MRARPCVVAASLAALGCSEGRPLQGTPGNPVSWNQNIAALYAAQCNSCHSGPQAPLGYRTTSYLEALGDPQAPVAIAGNANSKLLQVIDPAKADAIHQPVSGAFAQSRAWVVDGQLALNSQGIHEAGILNQNSADFHANLVQQQNYNFSLCQGCHGPLLNGGDANVSCQECHSFQVAADGSTTCSSCHGSAQSPGPPRDLDGDTATSAPGVGAHQGHLFGLSGLTAPIPCSTCHQVPTEVGSPGHIDNILPAKVVFSGLAVADSAAPVWDPNALTCSSVYCHGNGAGLSTDTAFQLRTPVWNLGGSQAFCGSCHGLPPTKHPSAVFPDCARCHPKTVTANGLIIINGPPGAQTSFHINGVVDVGP
jgi:predicted CxxxxCH...CXXCH cytochrome family protein